MDTYYIRYIAVVLALLQIGSTIATPILDANLDTIDPQSPESAQRREMSKRGGARAFYGFYNTANSKRDNLAAAPYYLYEKRGGGRAFNHNANLYRFDKRGGGRAFAGSWSPYLERFYDYKRSSYPIYFSDNSYY